VLVVSGLIGGLYDFIVSTFGLWTDVVTTRICEFGQMCADKFKVVFGVNTSAALLGLGYIIGLKYALIIAAGSALVWFVIVPAVGAVSGMLDLHTMGTHLYAMGIDGSNLSTPEGIFQEIGRPLGIGGIAMAGLIGIIRQAGIIKSAMSLARQELGGKRTATDEVRTQRDLKMRTIMSILIATLVATLVFFQFGILGNWMQTLVALAIVFVISFLFTTVAANAIAIVGSNPVSGMTLMTLILSSLVLVSIGLSGTSGMVAAMVIGGVVCTALSMAGGFITDLKIGYWLGTTPRKQETWKFVGTFVSAATVAGVMIILNQTYGFSGEDALVAPQANAMAAVIQPLMTGGETPWVLFFSGAMLALVLTFIGVPALAFALGMFIPMQLNAPLVVGGLVAWYIQRSKNAELGKARANRGTLIASGFIAGGALMGVVSAILTFVGFKLKLDGWAGTNSAEWLALGMYILLMIFFVRYSRRAKIGD
jgi:putative OPT family oligopeptide transporter